MNNQTQKRKEMRNKKEDRHESIAACLAAHVSMAECANFKLKKKT